jgi:ABC-type Fe3+/spermidine/putrescine transport system ATPase subunit
MSISFEQISKRYGDNTVVNDVSLRIDRGEFFVLLGPSGSGKSTLLRAAAGLTDVDHGRIAFNNRDVTHLPARQRGVGLVFQHYALFRHMTVGENVEFALRVRGVRRGARAKRRDELLQLMALDDFAGRMPGQLSGGQQQRVAVARALAHEPAVLLLDEPFGALDAQIRVELRDTIRQVQRRLGMTTILVTHDQEEAFALGDRIGVMHHGRLLEAGKPETLYRHPATRFVATFLGAANLFLGEMTSDGLRLGSARLSAGNSVRPTAGSHEVVTVVRPEDIEVVADDRTLKSEQFATGQISSVSFAGSLQRLSVQIGAESGVQSAVAVAGANTGVNVDITRISHEQGGVVFAPGRRVLLGVRRVHVLPTPISSFRLLGAGDEAAARLRRAPLLTQLADSMRAPVLEPARAAAPASVATDIAASSSAPGGLGVAVLESSADIIPLIGAAIARGTQRLLCIPPQSPLPRRVLICTDSDAARPSTLALVASVIRHLHTEATFVSVQSPAAARSDVTHSFRRLLDARAELLETHGLDIRTDVHIGALDEWLAGVALADEATLIVLGLDGTPADIERALQTRYQALFAGRCPVLLSCSNAASGSLAAAHGEPQNVDLEQPDQLNEAKE